MELKNFTQRALKRISPIYDESEFIQSFFNAASDNYDLLRNFFTTLREQSFIETVDWAIAYQETKYSLPIREDLTLEERRALLGIRAATHVPLNPGRLEKSIKDAFNISTYLYEGKAGYIEIYASDFTQAAYKNMLDFLRVERPAHLMLGMNVALTFYIGTGGDFQSHIVNPDKPLSLPKTPSDKKNYPRLFAGAAKIITGNETIHLAKPKNETLGIKIGSAKILSGNLTLKNKSLDVQSCKVRAGFARFTTGTWTIGAVLMPELDILLMPADTLRFYFGFNMSKHKTLRGFEVKNVREDVSLAEIKEVSDFVTDNEILKNEILGETVDFNKGAAWQTQTVLKYIIL